MERIRAACAPAELTGEVGAAVLERAPGGGPEECQRMCRKNFAKPDVAGDNAKMFEQYFAKYTWCLDEKGGSTGSDLAEIERQLEELRSCACELNEQDPKAAEAVGRFKNI